MTPNVKVTCDGCRRPITLAPAEVRLVLWAHQARYLYVCPDCETHSSRPADPHVAALLQAAGVPTVRPGWESNACGPPLTEDDLIRFGPELEAT